MNTLGTEVAVLNSQGVPISQVVLKTGFTVIYMSRVSVRFRKRIFSLSPGALWPRCFSVPVAVKGTR